MSARPNAPLDAASMSDRRSPPRHARGEPPARDRGGAGAAPAVPPGMGARETPNGPPKHLTSNWGRGAPRAPWEGLRPANARKGTRRTRRRARWVDSRRRRDEDRACLTTRGEATRAAAAAAAGINDARIG